ncbi:O-antigen ligase [Accumulibacter sp.]|uniref:O-antigen ligase family protein n=1 Tax=Accumulibacter sp. TaxID=2053492 RepID=UPI0025CE5A88|nr:O-antigen ligase family protein [Accumulibacter sp.]MCM8593926.1 O-antigen ligase family protein [Accumulibacter sp.]MCM8627775.1 O-antigen ligase family protein [Accumulibacter sp.]MDS4048067.1 O-antigen ligase family protein [Accumulibacter sp.]
MIGQSVGETLRNGFYRWGWLIAVYLPLAGVAGRAAFNVVSGIYFLWAAASMAATPGLAAHFREQRAFLVAYALMLLAWVLSLTQAADAGGGAYHLLRYVQFSLTGVFTLVALQQSPRQLARLAGALALAALLLIVLLYLELPYYLWAVPFDPTMQLREDNLPWLLPFLLLALANRGYRRWLIGATIVAFAVYIGLSQGRAALLAMLVALAVFSALGFPMRRRYWVITGVGILVIGILLGQRFFRVRTAIGFNFATVDRFFSGRAGIWWQALSSPPDNVWLGVGFGNLSSHLDILRTRIDIDEVAVKHLHNFVLDAWFETGLVGLSAFLVLLAVVIRHVSRVWPKLDTENRRAAAALLAAVAALLTAGLLSFSYASKQFSLYLYLLFAGLLVLRASGTRPASP